MKAGPLLLALAAAIALLAAFIAAHWFLYRPHFEADLTAATAEALRAHSPELDGVTPSFHALDATLIGTVPSLEARDQAQHIVDALPGARALGTDNQLTIASGVTPSLSGNILALAGYLPDEELKTRTLTFVKARRPDLEIDTTGLVISEHAVPLTFPEEDAFPGWLDALWQQIQEPAFLKIIHTGQAYAVEGLLPRRELRDDLLATLAEARADTNFNTENLRVSDHATHPDFLANPKLLEFISACIALPDPGNLTLSHAELQYGGSATTAQQKAIDKLAGELGIDTEPESNFTSYPSPYHVPGYQPESELPPEALKKLRNALDLARITFDNGSSKVSEEQTSKLDAAAAAIAEAGPKIKLAVGAHPDHTGKPEDNQKISQARAQAVIDALTERGIDPKQLDLTPLDPSPPPPQDDKKPDGDGDGDGDGDETTSVARRVDILVK